jgi:hypothetical protein
MRSTKKILEERELDRYEQALGRKPNTLYPGDPDWEYEGSKGEYEELRRRIGLLADDGSPVLIEGQEELFNRGEDRTLPPLDPVCAFHGKRWSEHEGGR